MPEREIPLSRQLEHLTTMANESLGLWRLPGQARARLINVSENATFLVEGGGQKCVLRIHRQNYHSYRAIECELAWINALARESQVLPPRVIPGRDGNTIQTGRIAALPGQRFMVMFAFIEGRQPDDDQGLEGHFRDLGAIAARTHLHALVWQRPHPFERLTWNLDTVFGKSPPWGDWRSGPNLKHEEIALLARVENTVTARLGRFGACRERYGLIHADMRLANLLVNESGTRLIDFDDCGFGWFLYDFAAAVSFIEDHPKLNDLREAWIGGYTGVRPLSRDDVAEIDSFIMLRRLALLAWIGSHIEAPEPQALAPDFGRVSAELGEKYLSKFG